MTGISTFAIARIGEKLVHDALPDAKWVNSIKETGKSHDIEWEGIMIDVKTATTRKKLGDAYMFNTGKNWDHDAVYVLVGLGGDKNYFWVVGDPRTTRSYKSLKDAVEYKDLPEAILKAEEVRKTLPYKPKRLTMREQIDAEMNIATEEAMDNLRLVTREIAINELMFTERELRQVRTVNLGDRLTRYRLKDLVELAKKGK